MMIAGPTLTEEEWQPFVYVQILRGILRLHINPPPPHLNITAYEIKVIKDTDKTGRVERSVLLPLREKTFALMYDFSVTYGGLYYFNVTPYHKSCQMGTEENCKHVESPKITVGECFKTCIFYLFSFYTTKSIILPFIL